MRVASGLGKQIQLRSLSKSGRGTAEWSCAEQLRDDLKGFRESVNAHAGADHRQSLPPRTLAGRSRPQAPARTGLPGQQIERVAASLATTAGRR